MVSQNIENNYKLLFIIIFLFIIFLSIVNLSLIINKANLQNEAVLYCEIANLNSEMFNEIEPYFQKYLDESIDAVSEINGSLGDLLSLQLVGGRDLRMEALDCPDPNCRLSFISPLNKLTCEYIFELRYG